MRQDICEYYVKTRVLVLGHYQGENVTFLIPGLFLIIVQLQTRS